MKAQYRRDNVFVMCYRGRIFSRRKNIDIIKLSKFGGKHYGATTMFSQLFGLNETTTQLLIPGESFHHSSCVLFISCFSWIRGPSNKLFHYHQSIAVLTFIKEVKLVKILLIDYIELEKVE